MGPAREAMASSSAERTVAMTWAPARRASCTAQTPTAPAPHGDQHHAALHRPGEVDTAMGCDAEDAEAGPLPERHAVGQRYGLSRGDDHVLGSRA
jgi:hypothetical protein